MLSSVNKVVIIITIVTYLPWMTVLMTVVPYLPFMTVVTYLPLMAVVTYLFFMAVVTYLSLMAVVTYFSSTTFVTNFTLIIFIVDAYFQIVDLALLVKQDMQAHLVDPVTQTLPSISHNLNQTSAMIAVMGQNNPNLTSPAAVSFTIFCVVN